MRYFHISNGLRGCYMFDNSYVVACNTRKELKAAIEYDARDMREAYGFGGSKKDVAAIAAQAWKRANVKDYGLPVCLPFGRDKGNYPYGIFVSTATQKAYREYCAESE